MKQIRSAANPFVSHLAELANQLKARRESGETLLEGLHLNLELQRAQVPHPYTLVVAESAMDRPALASLLRAFDHERLVVLSDHAFAKVSSGEGDNSVLAVIDVRALSTTKPRAQSGFQLWLDRVQDPGNVGTIIRTAAAAGANAVLLSPGCADAWAPKVLRAAMGGHFRVHVGAEADLSNAITQFQGHVFAAQARDSADALFDIDMTQSTAIVLGNEGEGIAGALLQNIHRSVRIPMSDEFESLNVSAAAAVIAFERVRQLSRR